MRNGSMGKGKVCQVCGSAMPHMPWGTDSCEWDPKWAQLAKDRAQTAEELVREVSGLSTQLSEAQARIEALEAALRLVKDGLESGHIKSKPIVTMDLDAEQLPVQSLHEIVSAALEKQP